MDIEQKNPNCSAVLSEIVAHKQTVAIEPVKERRCSGCGRMKPKKEFLRGQNTYCIECRRQYDRIYRQLRRKGEPYRPGVGIETWGQVDSVIREMAELQYKIQKEYAILENQIAILKKSTADVVEPELFHQINLRFMLKAFLKKTCSTKRTIRREFNFGILRFGRGKLEVDVDASYAGQRMGRP